jgi:hypothetical protein
MPAIYPVLGIKTGRRRLDPTIIAAMHVLVGFSPEACYFTS